jgi:predicted DNA-binding transcriptional regulator AlpA
MSRNAIDTAQASLLGTTAAFTPAATNTGPDEFLTKKELAKLCRCSERTIDRLLEVGDGPPVTRLSERRVIFPAIPAREWLSHRTVGAARTSGRKATSEAAA